MIQTIERIGNEYNNDGWFLINDSVQIRYVSDDEDNIIAEINYDDKLITEDEANELAEELLHEVMANVS